MTRVRSGAVRNSRPGVGRHHQEAVEEARQQAAPIVAVEAMIGDHGTLAPGSGRDDGDSARCATQMMRVDNVCPGEGRKQPRCDRVGRMPVEESERPECTDAQAARIADATRSGAEGDQFTVDVTGQRACQFERVSFAAAEQPVGPERSWSNVNDSHANNRSGHARRPGPIDGRLSVPSAPGPTGTTPRLPARVRLVP